MSKIERTIKVLFIAVIFMSAMILTSIAYLLLKLLGEKL